MVDDVAPEQVWQALGSDKQARLVDVRTDAEWTFVGVPDLSASGQPPALIPWQVYPSMQQNGAFADHLRQAGLTPDNRLYFLCRSGARSLAAAAAAQAAGYPHAYKRRRRVRGAAGRAGASRHGRRLEGPRTALATALRQPPTPAPGAG